MQTFLTEQQKLNALAARFYQGVIWSVTAGDYYTTSRNDMELYRVVKIEDDMVFTEYCTNPGVLTSWELEGFTTKEFGINRVFVPSWVLEHNKPE